MLRRQIMPLPGDEGDTVTKTPDPTPLFTGVPGSARVVVLLAAVPLPADPGRLCRVLAAAEEGGGGGG